MAVHTSQSSQFAEGDVVAEAFAAPAPARRGLRPKWSAISFVSGLLAGLTVGVFLGIAGVLALISALQDM
jgi:hypothetical protein